MLLLRFSKHIIKFCFPLKWDLAKTPRSWKGLIVKVQFQCKGSGEYQYNKEVYCVLIKYKGLFTGTYISGWVLIFPIHATERQAELRRTRLNPTESKAF